DVSEMSRQYRVSPSGLITLPLLPEPLQATGRTPRQLSGLISERLQTAGLVINPQATVEVKESRVHSIAVTGAVKKPQIYPLFGRTTLLDVLSQAEGLTEEAGSTATIIRGKAAARMRARGAGEDGAEQEDSPDRIATVDLKRLLEAGDSSRNLSLYPTAAVKRQYGGLPRQPFKSPRASLSGADSRSSLGSRLCSLREIFRQGNGTGRHGDRFEGGQPVSTRPGALGGHPPDHERFS